MNRFLIITGPTAVGKTAAALTLAKKYNGELVSADSRQIYRGMDIGTGKDLPRDATVNRTDVRISFHDTEYVLGTYEISGIPLWMYDVVKPDEPFSVSQYQCLARVCMKDIWGRGKLPIVVGGTGLYIQSLLTPFETISVPPDSGIRKKAAVMDVGQLQQWVRQEDISVWERLNTSDRQNPRRLVRKLELIAAQRHGIDGHIPHIAAENHCLIGLTAPRELLYQRIDTRVEERRRQGVRQEIETLLGKGYTWDMPSLSSLGYRQWRETIDGKRSEEETIRQWQFDEHAYARRQLTWMRRYADIHWIDTSVPHHMDILDSIVGAWYTTD